jgi:hypothetical protein
VTAQELVEHLVAAHESAPIPPKLVSGDSAPCKQNGRWTNWWTSRIMVIDNRCMTGCFCLSNKSG